MGDWGLVVRNWSDGNNVRMSLFGDGELGGLRRYRGGRIEDMQCRSNLHKPIIDFKLNKTMHVASKN